MYALRLSASVEVCTGLALLTLPTVVGGLLLGAEVSGLAALMARLFGLALLCLGIACWPQNRLVTTATLRAMLLYNVAVAAILAYLATAGHYHGALLWPAVLLHAGLTVWIVARLPKAAP